MGLFRNHERSGGSADSAKTETDDKWESLKLESLSPDDEKVFADQILTSLISEEEDDAQAGAAEAAPQVKGAGQPLGASEEERLAAAMKEGRVEILRPKQPEQSSRQEDEASAEYKEVGVSVPERLEPNQLSEWTGIEEADLVNMGPEEAKEKIGPILDEKIDSLEKELGNKEVFYKSLSENGSPRAQRIGRRVEGLRQQLEKVKQAKQAIESGNFVISDDEMDVLEANIKVMEKEASEKEKAADQKTLGEIRENNEKESDELEKKLGDSLGSSKLGERLKKCLPGIALAISLIVGGVGIAASVNAANGGIGDVGGNVTQSETFTGEEVQDDIFEKIERGETFDGLNYEGGAADAHYNAGTRAFLLLDKLTQEGGTLHGKDPLTIFKYGMLGQSMQRASYADAMKDLLPEQYRSMELEDFEKIMDENGQEARNLTDNLLEVMERTGDHGDWVVMRVDGAVENYGCEFDGQEGDHFTDGNTRAVHSETEEHEDYIAKALYDEDGNFVRYQIFKASPRDQQDNAAKDFKSVSFFRGCFQALKQKAEAIKVTVVNFFTRSEAQPQAQQQAPQENSSNPSNPGGGGETTTTPDNPPNPTPGNDAKSGVGDIAHVNQESLSGGSDYDTSGAGGSANVDSTPPAANVSTNPVSSSPSTEAGYTGETDVHDTGVSEGAPSAGGYTISSEAPVDVGGGGGNYTETDVSGLL